MAEISNIETGSLYDERAPEVVTQVTEQSPCSSDNSDNKKPENTSTSTIVKIASAVSATFSPLLIPTYTVMVALWATRLASASESARLSTAIVVLMLTCFLPLAVMLGAIRLGRISDTKVRSRKQRIYLYPVAIIAYSLCAIYLWHVNAPMWLTAFFIGSAVSCACAFAINFRWKISAHGTACGGFVAFMTVVAASGLSNLFFLPWLTTAIIIAGAVATSRLILNAHTPTQVYAGLILGFIGVCTLMLPFV